MNLKHITLALSLFAGLPALADGPSSAPATPAAKSDKKDIVATAVAAGNFKTLADLLTAADLVKTLQGPGPFTVFAPTDEAFAKLPKADLEALKKDKTKLAAVLTYHVIAGRGMAGDMAKMKDGEMVKTVNGKSFKFGAKGGKYMVDGANVTKMDIECSNGVIHVIDAVIMPPAK